MIMPVGHNMGWAGFWDSDSILTESFTWNTFKHWEFFRDNWEVYKNTGARYARTHLHNRMMDVEWEYVGNYKERLNHAWELDKLVDFWEHNDMLIHFNLMMHHQLTQSQSGIWWQDFNPNTLNEPIIEPHATGYYTQLGITNVVDYISNETSVKYLKQRMRYLISRYCYTTSIYLLELESEMSNLGIDSDNACLEEDIYSYDDYCLKNPNNCEFVILPNNTRVILNSHANVRQKVYDYHNIMGSYIKNTLNHTEHLLTTNYGGLAYNTLYPGINFPDMSYNLETFDVASFNYYNNSPDKLYISNSQPSFPMMIQMYQNMFGNKPIIMGEVGTTDQTCWLNKAKTNLTDLMTYGFTGIAGFNTWHGVDRDHAVFTHVKRIEDHLNGDDFINTLSSNNGIWSLYSETSSDFYPGGALNGKCENHYYVSFDKSKVVGFVRNRTWNFMTDNQSEPCYEIIENNDFHNFDIRTWQDNDFKLTNLLGNHNYRIDYYTITIVLILKMMEKKTLNILFYLILNFQMGNHGYQFIGMLLGLMIA